MGFVVRPGSAKAKEETRATFQCVNAGKPLKTQSLVLVKTYLGCETYCSRCRWAACRWWPCLSCSSDDPSAWTCPVWKTSACRLQRCSRYRWQCTSRLWSKTTPSCIASSETLPRDEVETGALDEQSQTVANSEAISSRETNGKEAENARQLRKTLADAIAAEIL